MSRTKETGKTIELELADPVHIEGDDAPQALFAANAAGGGVRRRLTEEEAHVARLLGLSDEQMLAARE